MTRRFAFVRFGFVAVVLCGGALGLLSLPVATRALAEKAQGAQRAQDASDIVFETSRGAIVVRVFDEDAPLSAKNLRAYVEEGFYSGLIFHRVIPGFMIQGGGFDKDLQEKPGTHAPVKNESTQKGAHKNTRGTLAMARTAAPDSAKAQFFINVVDNPMLDARGGSPGYAVVGEVVSGMDVVDAIRGAKTRCASHGGAPQKCEGLRPGMQDVPEDPVVITRARLQPRGGSQRR